MQTTATTTATFEVGATYSTRSAGDHNCVWTFEVVKRSAKFVTLRRENGDVVRVGVKTDDQGEWTLPFGSYSMAPVLRPCHDRR
jgi:hypothetical protein